MEKQKFPLGDILAVTTGLPVSTRGQASIFELMFYMYGVTVWNNYDQLKLRCRNALFRQHPSLKTVDISGFDLEGRDRWLGMQRIFFSEALTVEPIMTGSQPCIVQLNRCGSLVAQVLSE